MVETTEQHITGLSTETPATLAVEGATPAVLGTNLPDGTVVPTKFQGKTMADVLASVGTLETRLSATPGQAVTTPAPASVTPANPLTLPNTGDDPFAKFAAEVATTGQLSDGSRNEVKRLMPGSTDGQIDMQVRGILATQRDAQTAAYDITDGESNYVQMAQWAASGGLNPAEQGAFDRAAQSSDPAVRAQAVRGLWAQYLGAGGQPAAASGPNLGKPSLVQGTPNPQASQTAPYQSYNEFLEFLRTPKYGQDGAGAAEARSRCAASKTAGVVGF